LLLHSQNEPLCFLLSANTLFGSIIDCLADDEQG
jgi:hypothetical protein